MNETKGKNNKHVEEGGNKRYKDEDKDKMRNENGGKD